MTKMERKRLKKSNRKKVAAFIGECILGLMSMASLYFLFLYWYVSVKH